MSFFGFEQSDLEKEKRKFLDGRLQETEDLHVYTWGEDSYDGLGDALQEGGDELNDETFGGTGQVGKDFDFGHTALPSNDKPPAPSTELLREPISHQKSPSKSPASSRAAHHSLETIWDDRSPLSLLPRANGGAGRSSEQQQTSGAPKFSPFQADDSPPPSHQHLITQGVTQTGMRTLHEIEAEMRVAAEQQSRELAERQQQQQQQLRRIQLLQQQQFLLQQQRAAQVEQQRQEQLRKLQLQQQQQLQQQTQRTPPPRMLPTSQSPRFHERQQRQLLLLQQQQQELQEQQRLQELQEQLRMEELARQLRAQQLAQLRQSPSQFAHQRHSSGPSAPEPQVSQLLPQQRRQSPAFNEPRLQVPLQQQLPYLPQNVQIQQRLLAEMAQAEFIRDMQGGPQPDQEALRTEAMRKIMEAERMEEKRRRKAAKIAHMSKYNDLMTQSDKDFITRIQVSQLVTQDPYAEDFYAQVYGAILRSRLGLQSQDERVLKFGSGGGVGLGLGQQRGNNRRPSAMQRMEAQVERIVSNARLREKEKGLHSLHSLQGALGKTSGRSYKAAPRQLLQVDASTSPTVAPAHAHISKEDAIDRSGNGAAKEAAKLGREALGNAADTHGLVRKEPLSQRQVLSTLENMYDAVLRVEQLRREQPSQEDEEALQTWEATYMEFVQELWDGLMVMVPLETSDPHPFISLLTPTKGKRLLPRLTRHFNSQQMLTMLTLLVACFNQLDVVRQAPILDSQEESREQMDGERQTQAFLGSVLQSILPVVAKAALRLISGLLGLLLDRSDIVAVAKTRPGLALLTLFLSRVEVIKQSMAVATELHELPSPEEAQQWQTMLDHLFQLLAPYFLDLFPSVRLSISPRTSTAAADQPVWQFLAALALHASTEQQQILVTSLREKVLQSVLTATKGWNGDQVIEEEERVGRLTNVNLFLHALGLDSSQITL